MTDVSHINGSPIIWDIGYLYMKQNDRGLRKEGFEPPPHAPKACMLPITPFSVPFEFEDVGKKHTYIL